MSVEHLDEIWNACLYEVLKEIDARTRTNRAQSAALTELRDDLVLLHRPNAKTLNGWHYRSDRRGDTPSKILVTRAGGSIGIPARDFHRGPEYEAFHGEGPKIRMQSDHRAVVVTLLQLLDGRSPDTNPAGHATLVRNSSSIAFLSPAPFVPFDTQPLGDGPGEILWAQTIGKSGDFLAPLNADIP